MSARTLLVSSVLASLAALTGCGPLLFVEAETEEICKSVSDLSMPGVPGGQAMTLETSTSYDLGGQVSQLQSEDVDGDLELTSLTFTPKTGITDFSFIDSAKVSVVDGEATETVLDYSRAASAGSVAAIQLASATPKDLFPYLQKGTVILSAKLAGTFPTADWSMDAKACFRVRAKVNYASALANGQGGN